MAWVNPPPHTKVVQWKPSRFFPGNNLNDFLAKVGAIHDSTILPLFLSSLISFQRLFLYTSWRCGIQSGFFQHQIPAVSSEKLSFQSPHSVCFAHSRLRCNRHSTLITYLHRIGRAETFLLNNFGSESQDLFYFVLDCPAPDSLRLAIFGHSRTILDLWSRSWGFPDYWDFPELICALIPRNELGKPTTIIA